MAILEDGPNGGFSGKVGSVIGVIRFGTAIIRGMPRISRKNKKGSPAQNVSRSRFTQMQYFLKPVLYFIRVGFNLEAKSRSMTAHNAAKSYNMLNAFNDEGNIDYSKIVLSFGNLPGALNATVAKDDAGLHFTWDDNTNKNWELETDQVMLLAYDPANNSAFMMLSGARRTAKMETLQIHERASTNEFHTWIAFISDDRQRISMSTYVGVV